MAALLKDFITAPEYAEQVLDRVAEGVSRYLEAILRTGACDALMFENAGACRELMGPRHLERFVMPRHRRLLEAARRRAPEVLLIEHNCSRTPYFEEVLGLDVDAVSFAYGDVRAIRERHAWDCHASHTVTNACLERFCLHPRAAGKRVAWIGNVDHTRILLQGSPEQVHREARACIDSAHGAPFVLSTGCEIPYTAPLDNIRALARAAGS
jgi:uroporphyrinogen-III decarboxylase